jgi:hypothetical protein
MYNMLHAKRLSVQQMFVRETQRRMLKMQERQASTYVTCWAQPRTQTRLHRKANGRAGMKVQAVFEQSLRADMVEALDRLRV